MRKHQFVKKDCKCARRATNWVCRLCGAPEYGSVQEMHRLVAARARCEHPDAPLASPEERFKGLLGGTFDCLAAETCATESA